MAFLSLKDVGKIYVSDGNVSVGIRGVNLSFELGEFVAVTGKSGSGKSTLLNVISGMDSYEEGELYIEGQSTSHYLQPEWEEYREKYISFIFQDYNIIESFTVLQNVELALLHIADKKERRARAKELICRVGLGSHMHHKGSKLSGGQKQRTVIARALAKDSPIILADEPTGNLDSATSKEIIELLREVSKDKLLIVVTHNFEQVETCATRHIRVFDGAVESDHVITPPSPSQKSATVSAASDRKKERLREIRNGLTLGRSIFTSRPKLSIFLCLLMILGTMGIFLVTSLCGGAADVFKPNYMFTHIDGRLILTTRNGSVLSEEQVKELAEKYGAESYLRFDVLLDDFGNQIRFLYEKPETEIPPELDSSLPQVDPEFGIEFDYEYNPYEYVIANYTYGETFGDNILGRYPEAPNEVFLYLPISYQPTVGKDEILAPEIEMLGMTLKVTGVKYYYDNNLFPKCLFTEEGFRTATAICYLQNRSTMKMVFTITEASGEQRKYYPGSFVPSFDMPADKIYVKMAKVAQYKQDLAAADMKYTADLFLSSTYFRYDYFSDSGSNSITFERLFDNSYMTNDNPAPESKAQECVFISDEALREIAETVLNDSYRQVSLFFENDKAAYKAAKALQDDGYIAVPSDTTYTPDAMEAIMGVLLCLVMGGVWIVSLVFLAFFINLCSGRTLSSFKGDMAIMRSMGIPVKVIRIGMYVRMLIALIPAFLLVVATAVFIFTSPAFNEYFVYLYAWQYALIFLGMILLTVRITHKQIRKLFGESVKKSLRGGAAA
ncbi:MAG: ATP-binding cassette domain-containing protein [Clostridia bacterium]|nr:ATP-binding cassette domain-containing protein [Clostridia bacterium]